VSNAHINLSEESPVLRQQHDIVEMTLYSVESPIYLAGFYVRAGQTRFWAAESTNCRILTTNNTINLNINILSINQDRKILFMITRGLYVLLLVFSE
jgi:hypothetical protein